MKCLPFVALCTVILSLSATELSEATPTEALPDLLKQGLDVYKTLQDDMRLMLGLKKYAEHLSTNIIETSTEVNQYLDEKEKVIVEKLITAQSLVHKNLDKVMMVLIGMKEQSNAMVLVLDPSAVGTDQEKLWATLQYFSRFAKNMEEKIEDVEGALLLASNIFHNFHLNLSYILEQVQGVARRAKLCRMVYVGMTVADTISLLFIRQIGPLLATSFTAGFAVGTSACNSFEEMVYVGATVAGTISLYFIGPIGPLLTTCFIASFANSNSNKSEGFLHQQRTISGYIKAFESMFTMTKELQERLNVKHQRLLDIRTKLSVIDTFVGVELNSLPLLHFELIYKTTRALVEACITILEDKTELKKLGWVST